MAEESKIQWTDATFNPWRGCVRVSPGCERCYAEQAAKRNPKVLGTWGRDGARGLASEAYWRQPVKWNTQAAIDGRSLRVFCASLADVFEDRRDLDEHRARLFRLIEDTPCLDWQLLTKRPENVLRMVPDHWLAVRFPPNAWLGTTVEDRRRYVARVPHLVRIPAAVRFLSAEPLLEDLGDLDLPGPGAAEELGGRIHWIIVGGESGGDPRPFDFAWARSIRDQARAAGAALFVKQAGSASETNAKGDHKGGDLASLPEDLRIRQFPRER